ncbi:MAG: RNA pseudouridine synthase [Flavobacteriaceae bacterium]|nr:MAG: RNA pseudouridine synthase [Flavobacteriaceae bacterium]
MIHEFIQDVSKIEVPKTFAYVHYYTPDKLAQIASEEFQENYLKNTPLQDLEIGKMIGVLVVEKKDGKLGYLSGYSGSWNNPNLKNLFVPPIVEEEKWEELYRKEIRKINLLKKKELEISTSKRYLTLKEDQEKALENLTQFKQKIKEELAKQKAERDLIRKKYLLENPLDLSQKLEDLNRLSSLLKVKAKHDLERYLDNQQSQKKRWEALEKEVKDLKQNQKELSLYIRENLYKAYSFLSYQGKRKNLKELFEDSAHAKKFGTPPSGAGDCAAPRLFQFAYLSGFKPLALAEFWWGPSPESNVRKHKQFYNACMGKCEPILKHMMQGLPQEQNPLLASLGLEKQLPILFEDPWIVAVNKPHEFLSVPGKQTQDSVYERIKNMFPAATGPLIVHRLDMSTSGVLILAKDKESHKKLQKQFIEKTIQKKYIALLEGCLNLDQGEINLPLVVDYFDRPKQKVCEKTGRKALTKFKVLEKSPLSTRILFSPITGRTHQLRVHAAHYKGLNHPIQGDDLYGTLKDRLYLHAYKLKFTHPYTQEVMEITAPCPF